MLAEQLVMRYTQPRGLSRAAAEQMLVDFLRAKEGWVSRDLIALMLGWPKHKVRRVAAKSDWIVGRIGTEGYKLIQHATREEYEHCRNSRRSCAREILGKVVRQDRIFFGRQVQS